MVVKSGMLQSMELQRVGHDWATELNWCIWHPSPVLKQQGNRNLIFVIGGNTVPIIKSVDSLFWNIWSTSLLYVFRLVSTDPFVGFSGSQYHSSIVAWAQNLERNSTVTLSPETEHHGVLEIPFSIQITLLTIFNKPPALVEESQIRQYIDHFQT